jgi:DNA polymerase-3 subunit alpha
LRAANKKAFENLALAGGFDEFGDTHRAQYFHTDGDNSSFLEKAMRFGAKFQENENSSQVSLFGDASDVQIAEPTVPPCEEWNTLEKLSREKEVVGIYISGHPLDDYKFEMKYFCNTKLQALHNLEPLVGKNLSFGGIVSNVQHRTTQQNKGWATFNIEGYEESFEFRIFNEEYLKFRHYLVANQFVYIKIFVKEGWTNKDTGKKSEPRINFTHLQSLQDVLPDFAKKLTIQLPVEELKEQLISNLKTLFSNYQGDYNVTFEVLELEKVKRFVKREMEINDEISDEIVIDSDDEVENLTETIVENQMEEIEETIVKNKLEMPSRKLKISISKELLDALEKMQVNFKLN